MNTDNISMGISEAFDSFNDLNDVIMFFKERGKDPEVWKYLTDNDLREFNILGKKYRWGVADFLTKQFAYQFDTIDELFNYFENKGTPSDLLSLITINALMNGKLVGQLFLQEINNKFGVGTDIAVLNCIINREDFNSDRRATDIILDSRSFNKQIIKNVLLKYGNHSAWNIWLEFLSKGWVEGCQWLKDEWDITINDVVMGVLNDEHSFYLWGRMKYDFNNISDKPVGVNSVEWIDIVKDLNYIVCFNVRDWDFYLLFSIIDSAVSVFNFKDFSDYSKHDNFSDFLIAFIRYSYISINYTHKINNDDYSFIDLFEEWFVNVNEKDRFNLQLFKGFMNNVVVEGFPYSISANLAMEEELTKNEFNEVYQLNRIVD